MENAVREGVKTTEFLFAVVVVAAATILLAIDKIDEDTWKWAITTVGGAYIVSRGFVKGTANTAMGKVASFKSDLAILATAQANKDEGPASVTNVAVVSDAAAAPGGLTRPPAVTDGRTIPPGS